MKTRSIQTWQERRALAPEHPYDMLTNATQVRLMQDEIDELRAVYQVSRALVSVHGRFVVFKTLQELEELLCDEPTGIDHNEDDSGRLCQSELLEGLRRRMCALHYAATTYRDASNEQLQLLTKLAETDADLAQLPHMQSAIFRATAAATATKDIPL
jgi:predicted mannosyl-3-phosphoglycerate phosphatase (HAD superfamily)